MMHREIKKEEEEEGEREREEEEGEREMELFIRKLQKKTPTNHLVTVYSLIGRHSSCCQKCN